MSGDNKIKQTADKIKNQLSGIRDMERYRRVSQEKSNGFIALLERYINDRDILYSFDKKAVARFREEYRASGGKRGAALLTTRNTWDFYSNYVAENLPSDIVAKEFFRIANYDFPLVQQVIGTLEKIRDRYFPKDEIFNSDEVWHVINHELKAHLELFDITDESYAKGERKRIFRKMTEIMESVTDKAAVIYAIDAIKKPKIGDGIPYFMERKLKTSYAISEMLENKQPVAKEHLEALFGLPVREIPDMAKIFVQANFHKREIREFVETGKISLRENYFYDTEQKRLEDKIRGVLYNRIGKIIDSAIEESPDIEVFGKEEVSRLIGSIMDNMNDSINRRIQTLDLSMTYDRRSGYFEKFIDKATGELSSQTGFVKNQLRTAIDIMRTIDDNTMLKELYVSDINTYADKEKRRALIDATMDAKLSLEGSSVRTEKEVVEAIAKKSGEQLDLFAVEDIKTEVSMKKNAVSFDEHVNYIIRQAERRKEKQRIPAKMESRIPQSQMTRIFNAHLDHLVPMDTISFRTMADGTRVGGIETVKMLPVKAFGELNADGKMYFEPEYDYDRSDNKVSEAVEGAFIKAKFNDIGKAIEGTLEVVNPSLGGTLPLGHTLTTEGERAMERYWSKENTPKTLAGVNTDPRRRSRRKRA